MYKGFIFHAICIQAGRIEQNLERKVFEKRGAPMFFRLEMSDISQI